MKAVVSIALVYVLVLSFSACTYSASRTDSFESDSLSADQEGWNVSFSVSENGSAKISVFAEYMARFEEEDSTYLELGTRKDSVSTGRQVRIEMFDENGMLAATTRADRVLYTEEAIRFVAENRVSVVTPEGRRLECQKLSWDQENNQIIVPGFVKITSPTESVQGYNLKATASLADYTIFRISGQAFLDDDF